MPDSTNNSFCTISKLSQTNIGWTAELLYIYPLSFLSYPKWFGYALSRSFSFDNTTITFNGDDGQVQAQPNCPSSVFLHRTILLRITDSIHFLSSLFCVHITLSQHNVDKRPLIFHDLRLKLPLLPLHGTVLGSQHISSINAFTLYILLHWNEQVLDASNPNRKHTFEYTN